MEFHSQLGIATVSGNADTWTDQINGVVCQAPGGTQRPVYAADGTAFGGKPVVQCASTGSLYLRNLTINTSLVPAGSTPWIGACMRTRTIAVKNVWDMDSGAGVSLVQNNLYINGANDYRLFAQSADRVTLAAFTTGRQFVETFYDGVNANIVVDGTVKSAAFAGATTGAIDRFAIGAATTASLPSDTSFALILICSSVPSASQRAAIRALALAEFPP